MKFILTIIIIACINNVVGKCLKEIYNENDLKYIYYSCEDGDFICKSINRKKNLNNRLFCKNIEELL